MKISEYDAFVKKNKKTLQRVHLSTPHIGDPIVLGIKKPPEDFQRFLGRMRDRVPGARKESFGRKFSIPRE